MLFGKKKKQELLEKNKLNNERKKFDLFNRNKIQDLEQKVKSLSSKVKTLNSDVDILERENHDLKGRLGLNIKAPIVVTGGKPFTGYKKQVTDTSFPSSSNLCKTRLNSRNISASDFNEDDYDENYANDINSSNDIND
jgi:hypothetical protein